MKGVLMLFEDASTSAASQQDTEKFDSPQITKVEVTIEGILNKLYSQGLRAYQLWDEAWKHFATGSKRHPELAAVAKDLALADVSLEQFLTSKHCLWLDLRSTDDRFISALHWWQLCCHFFGTGEATGTTNTSGVATKKPPPSAIICGQTVFILDLLKGPYRWVFRHIVILCPTTLVLTHIRVKLQFHWPGCLLMWFCSNGAHRSVLWAPIGAYTVVHNTLLWQLCMCMRPVRQNSGNHMGWGSTRGVGWSLSCYP